MITSGYWTLIETGGNQAYIFGTNKRRANVGGSELIHRVGNEWTRQAISDVLGSPAATAAGWQADPVVCASGKALILTSHPECGRAIVSKVTERALREAPGLGVWGVVATEPADPNHIASGPCACAGCQLEGLHEAHATVRQRAGSPLSRFPTLPFHQPCPFTGAPAVTLDVEVSGEDPRPMSAG
ncbi:MAG: hypothetical protein QG597_3703, partial [Actinomycetota bacterium]|nr:hypothetical protein [Actinomycetota bacterium]